jgi:hypothetical protein
MEELLSAVSGKNARMAARSCRRRFENNELVRQPETDRVSRASLQART